MVQALGVRQRTKAEVQKSITAKIKKIDDQDALELLDKLLDKPNCAKIFVKYKFMLLNF